jgi:hypothetical protein
VIEERICTKFNKSVKMLFASWFESEYARNSIDHSKCCLHHEWRANMHEIQWILQNVVYIVIGKRIYTKFNESTKMSLISWLKMEYTRNSINQSKWSKHCGWRGNIKEIQWIHQDVVYIVSEERICMKFNESSKCCLHRDWRVNIL